MQHGLPAPLAAPQENFPAPELRVTALDPAAVVAVPPPWSGTGCRRRGRVPGLPPRAPLRSWRSRVWRLQTDHELETLREEIMDMSQYQLY
jgi:hypothetical protein